jgi:hypothetical protein
MNATDKFENWFNTEGIRTYDDKNHGTADGHKWYMKQAFMQGYKQGIDHATEILLDPLNANIVDDDYSTETYN